MQRERKTDSRKTVEIVQIKEEQKKTLVGIYLVAIEVK